MRRIIPLTLLTLFMVAATSGRAQHKPNRPSTSKNDRRLQPKPRLPTLTAAQLLDMNETMQKGAKLLAFAIAENDTNALIALLPANLLSAEQRADAIARIQQQHAAVANPKERGYRITGVFPKIAGPLPEESRTWTCRINIDRISTLAGLQQTNQYDFIGLCPPGAGWTFIEANSVPLGLMQNTLPEQLTHYGYSPPATTNAPPNTAAENTPD